RSPVQRLNQPLSDTDAALLDHLRRAAMTCRAKPRADLFHTCALLRTTPDASREAHAEALMRCLPEALGQPARLHAPGADVLTFDERWLLELLRAATRGDTASTAFLLGRRVGAAHRRLVRYLVSRVAESVRPRPAQRAPA
ncbi:MAG: hypothetical protein AAFO86_07930, partial [Pseudomonadota bacterium]